MSEARLTIAKATSKEQKMFDRAEERTGETTDERQVIAMGSLLLRNIPLYILYRGAALHSLLWTVQLCSDYARTPQAAHAVLCCRLCKGEASRSR